MKIQDAVIAITGGAQGLGKAMALGLAKKGANLALIDMNQEHLTQTQAECEALGIQARTYLCDVSVESMVENTFQKIIEHFGKLDGLINNVGIAGPTGMMEDVSVDDWKTTIDTNLNSHFYFTKDAIPLLKRSGGSIVNLSSTAGIFGFPLRTPYAASKWAIIGVTKSLAMELGDFNIRVNAICPGSVSGDRIDRVIKAKSESLSVDEKELREDFESMVSLKTFVDKEDIANMVVFLLSEEAKRVSGQIMTVDGNTERMD